MSKLRSEMQQVLQDQYRRAAGRSHATDKARGLNPYKYIYSNTSLKQSHEKQANQFAKWLERERPHIERMRDITRADALDYLRHREATVKPYTVSASQTALNHIFCGSNKNKQITEPITKKEYNGRSRYASEITKNRRYVPKKPLTKYQAKVIDYAKAFGLRRSEVVQSDPSSHFYATPRSLYEKDGTLWHCTHGKNGLYRQIECLKSQEEYIRENYGELIQETDRLPTASEWAEIHKDAPALFPSGLSDVVNVHALARQYYASEKLNELEEFPRELNYGHFYEDYEINGRIANKDDLCHLSKMLGHRRLNVLSSYIHSDAAEEPEESEE